MEGVILKDSQTTAEQHVVEGAAWEPPAEGRPLVSVIMALTNHRGRAPTAVERWKAQVYPDEDYSLILGSDGCNMELVTRLQALLRDQDFILIREDRSELELYNECVEAAGSEWIFITEPHCEPEPDVLRNMMSYLADAGFDGAACYSDGLSDNNYVARLEDEVFAADFATKGQEAHWNKIVLRGFALRRSAYLDAGGFAHQYGHFSEPLLGAELRRKGYRLGTATKAVVHHGSTPRLKWIVRNQLRYGMNQSRCLLDAPTEVVTGFFGLPWDRYGSYLGPRKFLRELAKRCLRARKAARVSWTDIAVVAGHGLVPAGTRRCTSLAAIAVLWGAVELGRIVPGLGKSCIGRLWKKAIERGRMDYLTTLTQSREPVTELSPKDMGPHNAFGLYPLTRVRGSGWFRWTRAAAMLVPALEPGEYRITISLLRLRPYGREEYLVVEAGGSRVVQQCGAGDSIELDCVVEGNGVTPLPLTLVSSATARTRHGRGKKRRVGVAISGVTARRL